MVEEGMDFYYTPLEAWLSHSLLKVHKRGGKVVSLLQHEWEKKNTADELADRLEQLNQGNDWNSN